MAWTIATKADVTALTQLASANLKDIWSTTAEAVLLQYLGAENIGTTATVTDEYHSGDGTPVLTVKHPPISSVIEVNNDGYIHPATDYVNNTIGITLLDGLTFTEGTQNTTVSYVSGTTTVDSVVKLACALMIAAIANYEGRAGSDASIKWGTVPTQEGVPSPVYNAGLTSHLVAIMRNLLRRYKVRLK